MSGSTPEARYRRRVLGVGGMAAFLLYVVGAPIYNNRIENDLERRVPAALAAAGHGTVTAKFSGQEGTITCTAPLADPVGALAVAHEVRGVYSVDLDRRCRVNTLPGDDPSTSSVPGTAPRPAATAPEFASVGAVLAGDPQFSSLRRLTNDADLAALLADTAAEPVTVFAPTDDAFDALPAAVAGRLDADSEVRTAVARRHVVSGRLDTAALAALDGATVTTIDGIELPVAVTGDPATVGAVTLGDVPIVDEPILTANGVVYALGGVLLPPELVVVASGPTVAATLSGGVLTLSGAVADGDARAALVFAATAAVGEARLDDQLTLDPQGLDAAGAAQLATLIAALDAELVSGQAGYDGTGLYLSGAFANDADRVRAEAAATAVGAAVDLEPRAAATPDQAAALEAALNEFVRANPINFEPNSAVLDDSAVAVIDRLAAQLVEYGGLTVVVEGHTDSDGSASTNQALSEQRAAAVRQALIERGVDPETITSQGFGSTEPVLGTNGIEDKTLSRRVEFEISA